MLVSGKVPCFKQHNFPSFRKKPTFVGLPICAVGLSWAGATGSEIHLSESLCDLSMVGHSFKDIHPDYFYTLEGNLMVINPVVKKDGWR